MYAKFSYNIFKHENQVLVEEVTRKVNMGLTSSVMKEYNTSKAANISVCSTISAAVIEGGGWI